MAVLMVMVMVVVAVELRVKPTVSVDVPVKIMSCDGSLGSYCLNAVGRGPLLDGCSDGLHEADDVGPGIRQGYTCVQRGKVRRDEGIGSSWWL